MEISFHPDPRKQAQEVISIHCFKSKKLTYPPLLISNNNVSQKHLGVILDFKLTFEDHFHNELAKVNKTICHLGKLRNLSTKTTLITICKAFIRPHMDYGEVLYDQAFNNSFKEKLELIECEACSSINRSNKGYIKRKNN